MIFVCREGKYGSQDGQSTTRYLRAHNGTPQRRKHVPRGALHTCPYTPKHLFLKRKTILYMLIQLRAAQNA